MNIPASSHSSLPWYLLGAGNMGLLAAHYLLQAGFTVIVLRRDQMPLLERTLVLPSGEPIALQLPCQRLPKNQTESATNTPIQRLIVACKAPFSAPALAAVPLTQDATVLRLQNGLGSLDNLLPSNAQMIEVVSNSAVKRDGPSHRVIAENDTWMGPGITSTAASHPPEWFHQLVAHWPKLHWPDDFRHRQWRKLVANAVINPLTALYDVANGRLFQDPTLSMEAEQLAAEADQVLTTLDATWPGDTLTDVQALAQATANNTSSMRADMQAGATTEIDAINGWLLRQAEQHNLNLPTHRRIVAAIKARHP